MVRGFGCRLDVFSFRLWNVNFYLPYRSLILRNMGKMKVRRNHDKNPDFVSHGTYKYTRVSESKRRKKENAEKSKKNLDVSGIEPETFYIHRIGNPMFSAKQTRYHYATRPDWLMTTFQPRLSEEGRDSIPTHTNHAIIARTPCFYTCFSS